MKAAWLNNCAFEGSSKGISKKSCCCNCKSILYLYRGKSGHLCRAGPRGALALYPPFTYKDVVTGSVRRRSQEFSRGP